MSAIVKLAAKDLKVLLRNPAGAIFTFVWPLLLAILFGSIFAGPSGRGMNALAVAVVDEDQSEGSAEFLAELQRASELEIQLATRTEAWTLVRRGRRAAYVAILPGFGAARRRVFWGDPPELELGVDPRRQAETGMLEGILTRHAVAAFERVLADPAALRGRLKEALATAEAAAPGGETARFLSDLTRSLESMPSASGSGPGWRPIQIQSRAVAVEQRGPVNPFAVTFAQGILWGILGCAASFGVGIVRERIRGTLVRLQISPLTRGRLLLAKGLACFTAILAVEVLLLAIGRIAFGVRPTSAPLLAVAALCVAVAFVGIMMLFSVLGRTEEAAAGLSWAANIVMSMAGGGMIPLFLMPGWMQTASHASPAKWAVIALEGPLWRGFSAGEMLLPCGILLGVGVLCFAVGARAFRGA